MNIDNRLEIIKKLISTLHLYLFSCQNMYAITHQILRTFIMLGIFLQDPKIKVDDDFL